MGRFRVLYRVYVSLKDCVFSKILKNVKAVFNLSAFNDRGAKERPMVWSETERRQLGPYIIILDEI